MTDKNDEVGPEALDEEILDQEESFDGEDWQDELPPEDDFHDHDDFQDEIPLDDDVLEDELEALEDVDDSYDNQDAAFDQEAAKKRGRLVFAAVAGIGVLLAGGAAYMEFSEPNPQDARPVSSLLDIKEIKKSPSFAAKQDQTNVAPAPDKVDMVSLYQAGKSNKGVALPLPGTSNKLKVKKDNPKKEEITLSEVMVVEPVKRKMPPSDVAMPKKEDIKKIEEIKVPQKPKLKRAELAAEPLKTVKASANVEKRLADMASQMVALKAALDKSTQENATLISKMETMQSKVLEKTTLADKARVKALELKLAAKEAELKAVKTPVPQKSVVVRKKAPKKIVKKSLIRKKARKQWVLRGATPDSAWIAPSSHSKELRRVVVGDKISSIGLIKEIRQIGQKWQVIGTKGRIK